METPVSDNTQYNVPAEKDFDQDIGQSKTLNFSELFYDLMSESFILLEQDVPDNFEIMLWKINETNRAAQVLLNSTPEFLAGNCLKNFLEADYNYKLPGSFSDGFSDAFELYIKNLEIHLNVLVHVVAPNKLVCKLMDITENIQIKSELNKNLQRNELITEILNVFNDTISLDEKFDRILNRVSYHFNPHRILVLEHTENHDVGILKSQYAHQSANRFPPNFKIPLQTLPSWEQLLHERKMILGFSLSYLPKDIQQYFKYIKIQSAYIFPIWEDGQLYGSILFENMPDSQWDNAEINYLKLISAIISNLTTNEIQQLKLIKAKDKAEESDRLKSSFLANMSHDIRIPMNAIIGFSDLLADPDLTIGEREEFIEMISNSGKDLLTLIDNIIDVAKIDSGQLMIKLEDCSLETMMKELLSEHRQSAKLLMTDDLNLKLDLEKLPEKLNFKTDIFRFKQVFSNLIENGIKFTESGYVRFGISSIWGSTIEFYVEDSGIGIQEDTQEVIFERFSKVDRTFAREYNGTGLGLAICKSIVELLGGNIRVVSILGKGATFYFTHPFIEDESKLPIGILAEENDFEYRWADKTIVVAEDVEQNYMYLSFLLEPTQAKVIWAKNGREALDYFIQGNKADAVLMDIRMPVMDGIEATRKILELVNIPIIAQTAYTLGNEKELIMQAGCIDYISKPVNSELLYKRLQQMFL